MNPIQITGLIAQGLPLAAIIIVVITNWKHIKSELK